MSTKPKVHNVRATAEVQLTLRVKVGSTWGGDCDAEQIFRQAREEAIGMIENALIAGRESLRHNISIVGTPSIITIIGERK